MAIKPADLASTASEPLVPTLVPGYYEHNFRAVLETVEVATGQTQWHHAASRIADRIIHKVARRLERANEHVVALKLYRASDTPPARERQARLLDGATVERQALTTLEAQGRRGFFAENWLWKSLFGLAF